MFKFCDCLEEFGLGVRKVLLKGHQGQVNCVCLDMDGMLVSGSNDCTVSVWDCESLTHLRVSEKMCSYVTAFLFDCEDLITGHKDGVIRVNDYKTLKEKFLLRGHSLRITGLCVKDGKLYSGSWDCTVRVWNLEERIQEKVLEANSSFVNCVVMLNNSLVCGSDSRLVIVWDLETYTKRSFLTEKETYCIGVSPNRDVLVTGHNGGDVVFWNSFEFSVTVRVSQHKRSVMSVEFISDLNFISCSLDCSVILWDTTGAVLREISSNIGLTCLVHKDSKVYLGSSNSQIISINLNNNDPKPEFFPGHNCIIHRCIYLKNNSFLLTASFDGTIRLWDLSLDKEILKLLQTDHRVLDLSIDNKEKVIAACAGKTIYVWSVQDLQLIGQVLVEDFVFGVLGVTEERLLGVVGKSEFVFWRFGEGEVRVLFREEGVIIGSVWVGRKYMVVGIMGKGVKIFKIPE